MFSTLTSMELSDISQPGGGQTLTPGSIKTGEGVRQNFKQKLFHKFSKMTSSANVFFGLFGVLSKRFWVRYQKYNLSK